MRLLKVPTALLATLMVWASSQAIVVYSTSFEDPPFVPGSINGQDGWVNGSGAGASQSIINTFARTGTQSLQWDNSTLVSFYSVRRPLPGQDGAITATTPLVAEVWMNISPNTQVNRLYGIYLMNTSTGTLGGTNLGVTISGDGTVRGGTSWSATYTNTGLIGNDPNFVNNWVRVRLAYDGVGGSVEVFEPISNAVLGASYAAVTLGNANGSGTFFAINLGTDYFTTTDRTGLAYMDDLNISVVPEPGTLTALLAGAAALLARRRRSA